MGYKGYSNKRIYSVFLSAKILGVFLSVQILEYERDFWEIYLFFVCKSYGNNSMKFTHNYEILVLNRDILSNIIILKFDMVPQPPPYLISR